MTVYVDDAFVSDDPTAWGKWTGGGHMQADTLEELHEFAQRVGLRRSWFQARPGRPDKDHYDLTRARRDRAILLGAIPEAVEDGTLRRRAIRERGRSDPSASGPPDHAQSQWPEAALSQSEAPDA